MAGLLDFAAGVAGGFNKQQERKQELSMMERKAKLMNQLEMDLAERKAQLAQQYPTYGKFVTTATGDVIGITTTGKANKVYESDPETKNLLKAASEAKTAENVAQAEERAARIGLAKSQQALAEEKRTNPGKFWRPSLNARDPNQMTAAQYEYAYHKWLDQQTEDEGLLGKKKRPDTLDSRKAFADLMQSQGILIPSSTKYRQSAEPPAQGSPEGDAEDSDEYDAVLEAIGGMNFFETP